MLKISSLFLFAVLVLGIGTYPPIYSDSDNLSLDSSFIPNALAQSDSEARLEEKRKERLEKQEQRLAEREAKLAEREQIALERTEQLIQKLESKIQQLEQRLQNLVEKLESGEYYGNISDKVAEPKSLILTINGSASQINNSTNQLPLDGTISLSTQVIKDNAKKLKVDGGEIWIGDQVYDVVFGKARSSSSGSGGEKDSLVLIAQTSTGIDDEIKTLKLSIDLSSPIDPQSNESLEVSVLSPQSKIASEWFLSGDGTLSSGL